jgi:Domain of unknown function (DUF4268)
MGNKTRAIARMSSEQPAKPSAKPNLGRLEKIDISHYWQTDESDFTRWLTQDENIKLLGDAIQMELEVVLDATQVEELQSDLLCRDLATEGWVLIGNQLKPANESHLGRLLTYGADINASAIVWIASEFLPEHRTTLNWLNQITQTVQFFGLEIELWRIGNTAMAAKFNLVTPLKGKILPAQQELPEQAPAVLQADVQTTSQKDLIEDTVRAKLVEEKLVEEKLVEEEPLAEDFIEEPIEEELLEEPLSDIQQQNLDFWSSLCDALEQRGSIIKPSSPEIDDRLSFTIGRAGFRLYAAIDRAIASLQAGLYLFDEDAQAYFGLLLERQDLVEAEMEASLIWDSQTEEPNCSVYKTLMNIDLDEQEHWPKYIHWLCECLEQLHETFSERVKVLNATSFKKPLKTSYNPLQNSLILPT